MIVYFKTKNVSQFIGPVTNLYELAFLLWDKKYFEARIIIPIHYSISSLFIIITKHIFKIIIIYICIFKFG